MCGELAKVGTGARTESSLSSCEVEREDHEMSIDPVPRYLRESILMGTEYQRGRRLLLASDYHRDESSLQEPV